MILSDVCEFIVDCPHSTAPDEGKGYENPDGTHTKLLESLKALNQLVEEARVTIRNNQTW
mgnify:CR=1 FL=1